MRDVATITGVLLAASLVLGGLTGCASKQPEESSAGAQAATSEASATERKAWDQDEMTSLTEQLAASVRSVRRAWRMDPAFANAQGNRRAATQLDQSLRDLDTRTTQLASSVSGGAGYDDTLNTARNIRVLLNDIDVQARSVMTGEWMHEQVRPAMELFNQVAAFYGSKALFDPETLQRTDRAPSRR